MFSNIIKYINTYFDSSFTTCIALHIVRKCSPLKETAKTEALCLNKSYVVSCPSFIFNSTPKSIFVTDKCQIPP